MTSIFEGDPDLGQWQSVLPDAYVRAHVTLHASHSLTILIDIYKDYIDYHIHSPVRNWNRVHDEGI